MGAFEASGIATKKLTQLNIQKHLDNFNLETQFGTYSKMHALSGGQKVKVVLAAAMWMEPHVLILDEPTNFLDRDSLGALATAIKNYAGGVIIISYQREFYSALCPEVWSGRRPLHRDRLRVDGRRREGAQEGGEGGRQEQVARQGGQVRRLRQQDRGEEGRQEDPQVGAQEDQEARRRAAQEGPGSVDRRGDREGGLRGPPRVDVSARSSLLVSMPSGRRRSRSSTHGLARVVTHARVRQRCNLASA